MLDALGSGVLAGLAVAMPLGPIGMLVFERGARLGLRAGAAAGLGVASADGVYALLAAMAGSAIAAVLAGAERELRIVSGVVLLLVVAIGLPAALRSGRRAPGDAPTPRNGRTYLAFLGLTAVNPLTVTIFAALIAGLPEVADADALAKGLFVAGAFAASAVWQVALAGAGWTLGARLPAHMRAWSIVAGYAIVTAMALRTLAAA